MAKLSDWLNIQQDPSFWDYSPEDRAIIKNQWFKENISPSQEFQKYSDEEKSIIFEQFKTYGDDVAPERTLGGTVKDVGIKAAQGVLGLAEAGVGLLDIPTRGAVGNALDQAGISPSKGRELLASNLSPRQKYVDEQIEKAEGVGGTLKAIAQNPSYIPMTVVENIPNMIGAAGIARGGVKLGAKAIPQIAKSIAGGSKTVPILGAAAGEGVVSAGQGVEQVRQQVQGPMTAKQIGLPVVGGIVTGAINLAGIRLANKYGFADPESWLVGIIPDVVPGKTVGDISKRIVAGGISEGLFQELTQGAQEQIFQNAALGKPLMENVPEAAVQGAVIGGVIGGGVNIISPKLSPPPITVDKPEEIPGVGPGQLIPESDMQSKIAIAQAQVNKDTAPMPAPKSAEESAKVFQEMLPQAPAAGAAPVFEAVDPLRQVREQNQYWLNQTDVDAENELARQVFEEEQPAKTERKTPVLTKERKEFLRSMIGLTADQKARILNQRKMREIEEGEQRVSAIIKGNEPQNVDLVKGSTPEQIAIEKERQLKAQETSFGKDVAVEAERKLKEAQRIGIEIEPTQKARLEAIVEASKRKPAERQKVDYSNMKPTGAWVEDDKTPNAGPVNVSQNAINEPQTEQRLTDEPQPSEPTEASQPTIKESLTVQHGRSGGVGAGGYDTWYDTEAEAASAMESMKANGFNPGRVGKAYHSKSGDFKFKIIRTQEEIDKLNDEFNTKQAEQIRAERDVVAKKQADREGTDGFADGLDPMRRGKVIASINRRMTFNGGEPMTVKDKVRQLVASGDAKLEALEEDVIKPMSRTRFNRSDLKEQDEHERKRKAAGKKTVYYVGGFDLGKTAYDYAKHLIDKTNAKIQPQPKGAVDGLQEAQAETEAQATPADQPRVETVTTPVETEASKPPWENSNTEDEARWYGTRAKYLGKGKAQPPFEGTIKRVLNNGSLIEISPDGVDSTFRVDAKFIEPISIVDNKEAEKAKEPEKAVPKKQPAPKTIVEIADEIAAKGVDPQASYGLFVKERGLKPEISAKEWLPIYRKSLELAKYKPAEMADSGQRQSDATPNVATQNPTSGRFPTKVTPLDQPGEAAAPTKQPEPAKTGKAPTGPATLRGRIKQMGGINFGNFKGELKVMPTSVKFLTKKSGVPIDLAERTLRDEGWIGPDEKLLEALNDGEILKRGQIYSSGYEAKTDKQKAADEKLKQQSEYEPEAPPDGEYVTMKAEDLPEGTKLTIIDSRTLDGWDEYEVIDKDAFGIKLQDGKIIELGPLDRVQVLAKDLEKAPVKDTTKAVQSTFGENGEPELFGEPETNTPPKAEKPKASKSDQEQEQLFGYNQKSMFGKDGEVKAKVAAKPDNLIQFSKSELSADVARRAHQGTSYVPEKRAEQEQEDYYNHIKQVHDSILGSIIPEQREQAARELEAYKSAYLSKLNGVLAARSGIVSTMIAGGSNFPVRQMQKRNDAEQKKTTEFIEWQSRAIKSMRKRLGLDGGTAISSDDSDATDRLQEKIDAAEKRQAMMRGVNKIVRDKKLSNDEKVNRIKSDFGLSESIGRKLLEPDYAGRIGFADYELTNNNANIRRMKQRIDQIDNQRSDETKEVEAGNGVKIVDSVEDNRVQIFFPGKPDEAIRSKLKANGFKWSPSVGAWQRMRSDQAMYWANKIVGDANKPNDGESKFKVADTITEEEALKHSVDPETVKPGEWAGRIVFHGTDSKSANNIFKKGINRLKSSKGYFGRGFYVASDYNLAKDNYADFSGDDEGDKVIAVKIKDNAKILDLRNEKDSEIYSKISQNGKLIGNDDFDLVMIRNKIDGLFDRSFGGVVIYNPKAVEAIKTSGSKLFRATDTITKSQVRDFQKVAGTITTTMREVLGDTAANRINLEFKPIIQAGKLTEQTMADWNAKGIRPNTILGQTTFNGARASVEIALNQTDADAQFTGDHETFHIAARWVLPAEKYDRLMSFYGNNEESAADGFARFMRGERDDKEPTRLIKRVFEQLRDFFRKLGNALRGKGFTTADSIFGELAGGKFAGKQIPQGMYQGAALKVDDSDISASEFNKTYPGHNLKYDGIQEGFGPVPDHYQFTAYSGPAKGATFLVKDTELDTIKKRLDEMIAMRGESKLRLADNEKINELRSTLESKFDEVMYFIVDKNRPIQSIQKQLSTVREDIDLFMKETQRPKITASRVKQAWDTLIDPLVQKMGEYKIDLQDLELYKHALHAPEANEHLRKANAKRYVTKVIDALEGPESSELKDKTKKIDKPDDWLNALNEAFETYDTEQVNKIKSAWEKFSEKPSGMTDKESAEILKRYEGDTKIEELGKMLDAINEQRLEYLADAGQIPNETLDNIKNMYEHYVPLMREGHDDALFGASRGLKPSGRAIKVRGGSTRNVVNILGHSIANLERAINIAEKARSQRALYGLIKENPENDVFELQEVKKSPRYDNNGNIQMYPNMNDVGDNEIRLMVDGKQFLVSANRDNKNAMLMMRTLKASDSMGGPILNSLAKVNRFLARINTSWSPEFMFTNFPRDLETAMVNIKDTGVKGKNMFTGALKSARAIYKYETGKDRTSDIAKKYKLFKDHGGRIGWSDVHTSVTNLTKKLERDIAVAQGRRPVLKNVRKWVDLIENANTAIENGIRLHVFDLATQQGFSYDKAAQMASDITVDFTKRGAAGPVINSLYLFANAGIQGSYRIMRAATTSRRVQKTLGAIVGAGFSVGMLNSIFGGEDDDDEKYIHKIEDYTLERNMVMVIPGTNGKTVKIPLPWGYNLFWNMGHEISRMITQKNYKPFDGMARMSSVMFNAFNPLQAGTLLQTLAPTIADPFAQVAENKNWMGGDLMPAENKFDKTPSPDSQRFWKSTGEIPKWLAFQANRLTGGDVVKKGVIDVSPETIELVADTVGGSAVRFAKDVIGLPIKAISGGDITAKNIPFARRFVGEQSEYANQRIYYNNLQDVLTYKDQLAAYKGTDRYDDIFKSNMAFNRLAPLATESEKQLRGLRKQLKTTDDKEKQKQIKEKMESIYKRFNKMYNERVSEQ